MPVRHFRLTAKRGKSPPRPSLMLQSALRLLAIVLLIATMALAHMDVAYAAGTVVVCSEAALEDALTGGGLVTFQCSGTILVTRTKVIAQDTTLDATGQRVVLTGHGIDRVFEVHAGVDLQLRNLSVYDSTTTIGGPTRLPATGYPPPPPPPNEWVFMALGGLALIVVSLLAGLITRPQARRRFR